MAINQQITSAPPAPQRSDPNTFADKADAFVAWLENLDDELNQWASECNTTQNEINQSESNAQAAKQDAETARDYANKWATEAEDTTVNDGINPEGYSAYHYARKSEEWYERVSTSQLWVATSNTSVEVGTGSKTFTLNEENRSFNIGSKLRIVATSDPVNVWMEGVVTDYTDNNLTINIGSANGSGSYFDWKISLNAGSDASSVNGFEVSQASEANKIVVSKSDGKIDINWIPGGRVDGFDADSVDEFEPSQTPSPNVIPVANDDGSLKAWIADSELLEKIKNVDGENSGLDADLVRGLPADFTCSKSQNGYTKLPNGLIIQWGYISLTTTPITITFPIAFPNKVTSFVALGVGNSNIHPVVVFLDTNISGYLTTQHAVVETYDAYNDNLTYYPVYWMAIGY